MWWPLAVFFLASSVFRTYSSIVDDDDMSLKGLNTIVLVAPFLPPANGVGDTPPLPYFLYPLVGIGVILIGMLYWGAWRLLPGWLGYELVPRSEQPLLGRGL